MTLGALVPQLRSGMESFHEGGAPCGIALVEFWRWTLSDLVSNSNRGILAEFLVARALGVPLDHPREEWAAWDLTMPEGIKVEVKSAAYVQSWHQDRLSTINFNTPKTRAIDPLTNRQDGDLKRHADVYVLALLSHQDKPTIDPLDLRQWQFFVVPTAVLDARTRSQTSITLPSLRALHGPGIPYGGLRDAVLASLRCPCPGAAL